jgi:hypothetical protein
MMQAHAPVQAVGGRTVKAVVQQTGMLSGALFLCDHIGSSMFARVCP